MVGLILCTLQRAKSVTNNEFDGGSFSAVSPGDPRHGYRSCAATISRLDLLHCQSSHYDRPLEIYAVVRCEGCSKLYNADQ